MRGNRGLGLLLTALLSGAPLCASAASTSAVADTDWRGIRHDLYTLMGWQVVATVIIYNAPFEFSNWSQKEKDRLGFEQWRENVANPVWDQDHWAVNYLLHPYWGAGYYIRGRERGFDRRESFWVAFVFSATYEFGIESFLEEPSIQDIIVTPLAGAAVGRYFERVRERRRARPQPWSRGNRLVLGLTDPLGALNRGVGRLFRIAGDNSDQRLLIGIQPVRSSGIRPDQRSDTGRQAPIDGARFTLSFRW